MLDGQKKNAQHKNAANRLKMLQIKKKTFKTIQLKINKQKL